MDLTVTYRPNPLPFSSAPLAKDAHTSILFKLPWKQRPTISRHKPVLRVLASANANGSDGFSWSSLARSVQQGSARFWSNFGESLKKDTGFDLEDAKVKVGEFVGSVRERVEKSGVVLERFRSDVVPEVVSWNQWQHWKWDDPHVIPANMTPEMSELFTRELTRYIEELAMNGLMNNRHILDVIALKLLENSRIAGLELGFNGTSSMALASANLLKTSTFNRSLFLQPFSHPFQSSFFIPEPLRPGTTTKSLCFPKRRVVPRSALQEWKEYEEAVKRKDLAGALRFLKSTEDQQSLIEPVNNGSFPAESTRSRLGELGPLGRERDWEVLDTCLNADDLKLVGNAYGLLKGRGFLPSFGKFRNIVLEEPRNVTPTVLKDSTGLEVTKFAPKKWGLSESSSPVLIGFLGGASFLIWQGIDLRPNLAVILGLAFIDSIFLGGCCLAQISSYWPPNRRRILIHEAGHLLIAYLMGCPVRGVILDPIVAVQMGIQGQAGTQFWDEKMANDLAEGRLDGIAFDRYSMVLFAGIAAEALIYGEAEGGENDENLFRSTCLLLQPPLSIAEMSNQARWSLLQSYNLLKWHKNAHRAAVKALESRSSLSDVIRRIEEAMANSN